MDKKNFSSKKHIAVLGAGCAGMAAALRLAKKGHKVSVLEQNKNVGGLNGGIVLNGNMYEYGPHLFHTTDPEIFKDVEEIAGKDIFSVKKIILIKFLGEYFKYPLSMPNVISKLPKSIVFKAFISFIFYNIKSLILRPKKETSETVLLRSYGPVLYGLFFKNYIFQVWGILPSQFSPRFAIQRIPRASSLDFLMKVIPKLPKLRRKEPSTFNYVENVEGRVYSTKRGFSIIVERMRDELKRLGGCVYLNSKVVKLKKEINGNFQVEIAFNHDKKEKFLYDGVISTIPINNMVKMIEPVLPKEIIDCANILQFRAIVFVGLLVKKERDLPASFIYFREHSFNRVTDLSYLGFEVRPKGCTILVAEISCSQESRFWKDDSYANKCVINELIKEKLITHDLIREKHVFRVENGYPVYSLGFEEKLRKILNTLNLFNNLETTGRQGMFQYVNSHIAMKMGYESADSLDMKLRKD